MHCPKWCLFPRLRRYHTGSPREHWQLLPSLLTFFDAGQPRMATLHISHHLSASRGELA